MRIALEIDAARSAGPIGIEIATAGLTLPHDVCDEPDPVLGVRFIPVERA
jgi:hypothetical protein